MAESAEVVFDATKINECITNLSTANDIFSSAYDKALEVQESIKNNSDMWSGKSNYAMQEFMDLCLQYHNKFVGGKDSKNPISQAISALKDAYDNSCNFYNNSEVYRKLRDL
ncbi:MAG: hypothetical protein GX309_09880 [Clostridiales bacterium]|nr:hypothetical protein [Clostridiales bacterium]